MILDDIQNLVEGSHWDIVKSDLHGLGERSSTTSVANRYARQKLKEKGKDLSSEDAEELTAKRGKHGFVGTLAGAVTGGVAGALVGGRMGSRVGSLIGGGAGNIIGRAHAQRKFIKSKTDTKK